LPSDVFGRQDERVTADSPEPSLAEKATSDTQVWYFAAVVTVLFMLVVVVMALITAAGT
jgi:hypothetical protein